jgi:uncharacterized protein YecT (DUF1311 family)
LGHDPRGADSSAGKPTKWSFWMTKTVLTAALLLVAALCGSQARAQQTSNPCDQAVTQMDINECSSDQYKKADAQLNTVYAAISK